MIWRQQGFTMVELLASAVATGVVIVAASAFMLRFLFWYDELSARVSINRHARETYEVLAFGGVASSTGDDATNNLYGLRGRHLAPGNGLRSNYALQYTSNNLTLTPDTSAIMSINCLSNGNPMPDCGTGNKTVQGWIGSDIQFNSATRSVSNETVEVTFTIMNPYEIQRAINPSLFAENYRGVFTLNRDENDP
jgi:prepilin-type N-terminal cleavage/methylation domain-containing protein